MQLLDMRVMLERLTSIVTLRFSMTWMVALVVEQLNSSSFLLEIFGMITTGVKGANDRSK